MFQYQTSLQCISVTLTRSHRLIFLLFIVYGAACDSVPDSLLETSERLPQITEFSITPQRVDFAFLDQSTIEGDSVHISLDMMVEVVSLGSPLAQVSYAILSTDTTGVPLRTGSLSSKGDGIHTGRANITLSALDVESYPVLVYAIDANNRLGGEARTALEYVRTFEPSFPPVIEELIIPERIQRPAAGEPAQSLIFIAEVSDPDGLNNVRTVEFWNESDPDTRYPLCDDGNLSPCGSSIESGDVEAGDGLYTRTVFILSSNSLGFNTFIFEAIDRAGLRSQQVSHTVEIYE